MSSHDSGPPTAQLATVCLRLAAVLFHLSCYIPQMLLYATILSLRRGRADATRSLWGRASALIQRLGPTFIKGAQILATRRDVLSAPLCEALSSLHDAVAPMSTRDMYGTLHTEYKGSFHELFLDIDETPVASGSVAGVYRARLQDGSDVALKIQRPGIEQVMAADLFLVNRFGALIARLPPLRRVPVTTVLNHLTGAIFAQLDFTRELENLARLRENLAMVPRVWVPRVEREASRKRVLVMEFIPGLAVYPASHFPEPMRRKFAERTLSAVYNMLFVDGFVHCDLHPGNLYFTPSGQVVVLDAGFTVQLSDRLRRLFAEFFLEMALGRGRQCAEIVVKSAEHIQPGTDIEGFKSRMQALVDSVVGLPAKEFSLTGFSAQMFDLQRRFGLSAAPELLFPLLSLLVIEGTVREFDPEADFQTTAKQILVVGVFSASMSRW